MYTLSNAIRMESAVFSISNVWWRNCSEFHQIPPDFGPRQQSDLRSLLKLLKKITRCREVKANLSSSAPSFGLINWNFFWIEIELAQWRPCAVLIQHSWPFRLKLRSSKELGIQVGIHIANFAKWKSRRTAPILTNLKSSLWTQSVCFNTRCICQHFPCDLRRPALKAALCLHRLGASASSLDVERARCKTIPSDTPFECRSNLQQRTTCFFFYFRPKKIDLNSFLSDFPRRSSPSMNGGQCVNLIFNFYASSPCAVVLQ